MLELFTMEKADIKIIFVDIDWTILNHNIMDFDRESIEALKQAQKRGVKICIATARPYHSMLHTGLLNLMEPDAFILTNGAFVSVEGKIVKNKVFDSELCKEVFRVCGRHHLCIEYSTEYERFFSIKPNRYVADLFKSYAAEVHPPVKKYKQGNISALMLMCPEKYDDILRKELPKGCQITRFDPYGADIHFGRVYKSDGIEVVLDYYGISKDNALAIGDDLIDISMFKLVKYSAALGNGKEEVKQAATYVTEHIDNHGVKKALEYYKVI